MEIEKQEQLIFVTSTRDHAAVWTFLALMPNDITHIREYYKNRMVQMRDGQWYMMMRTLHNTLEEAKKSAWSCLDPIFLNTTIVHLN